MGLTVRRHIYLTVGFVALFFFYLSPSSRADDMLPENVQLRSSLPLQEVGQGTYRRFGFRIYTITLWAPEGVWDPSKPYAIELHYARSLSRETMTDALITDIRSQNVADDATLAVWEENIIKTIPAVEDGDIMVGLAVPGKESVLFLNNAEIGKLHDETLSRAFFNIWLGENADEDLKADLLHHGS